MPKELWQECSHCKIITDLDEKGCPTRGLGHQLQIVEFTKEELKQLRKEGRIYTKDWAQLESRLSQ